MILLPIAFIRFPRTIHAGKILPENVPWPIQAGYIFFVAPALELPR